MNNTLKITTMLACCISLIVLLNACTKQKMAGPENDISEPKNGIYNPYQLSFDIAQISDMSFVEEDSLIYEHIQATQQISNQTIISDIELYPADFWPTIYTQQTEDSVVVFLSLAYQTSHNDTLSYFFDFIFLESLANLEEGGDKTYTYINPLDLHKKLTNWNYLKDQVNFRSSEYYPESHKYYFQAYQFYFEDEIMRISDILLNEEANAMVIDLNFNTSFKIASCGFFKTHNIQAAKLSGLIQL